MGRVVVERDALAETGRTGRFGGHGDFTLRRALDDRARIDDNALFRHVDCETIKSAG